MSLRAKRSNLRPWGLRLLRRCAPRNDIELIRQAALGSPSWKGRLSLPTERRAIEYGDAGAKESDSLRGLRRDSPPGGEPVCRFDLRRSAVQHRVQVRPVPRPEGEREVPA